MAFDNASAPLAQSKKPGDTFQVTPQYIAKREEIEEADGGGEIVELGLSRTDIARLGIHRINLIRKLDEPPIELHQNLSVTVTDISVQNWTRGRTVIVDGTAEIVKFIPKFYVRVDGISATDCRNLKDKFGPDFPVLIDANPSILAKTRYSPEKRELIVAACRREIKARREHPSVAQDIVDKLCACGVIKAKARRLAEVYDDAKSPYQFFLKGALTFLQADRFARLVNPERAEADRPFLFIIDQFVDAKHVIIPLREIQQIGWINFGVGYSETKVALNRLVELNVVRKIEKKLRRQGGP